ncbi:MAG: energy-coupling factor transporter ATPase [Bacilli bacterium]|nr:energy-coupling factor transporter ATPase [Bacilli bacterium]
MKSLELKNVSYSYIDNSYAIKDLSLEIEEGSYIALIGHNGSGKSTLAKLLIGLLPLRHGEITIHGLKLIKDNYAEIRSQIGIVFQNPDNQFIGSTVEDDIAFGLENRQIPHEDMRGIVDDYASKVGMKEYLKKEPTNLSGGQKQRVAIAGILALKPKIIIFDEATSMLDPRGRNEISQIIKEMRKNMPELTIISITHDVEEAYQADKVVLLSKGELKAYDEPSKIFSNKELIKECNLTKPFLINVKDECHKIGIDIGDASSIDEAVEKICQSK